MKFFDILLISIAIGFIIIGIHQSITVGFGNSYWIFMVTLVVLLWFKIRNNKLPEQPVESVKSRKKGSKLRKNKR